MQDLIILGAGGSSRAIAGAVEAVNDASPADPPWRLLGFLDDSAELRDATIVGYPVLGPIRPDAVDAGVRCVIGIASYVNQGVRQKIAGRLGFPPKRFATIVHPTAQISRHARLGCGVAVLQGAVVEHQSRIGNHVLISPMSIVTHDALVEDYVTLAQRATVCGGCTVCTNAYIGAGAVLRDGIEVGSHAMVGLGAIVTKNVAPGRTVIGNPARALGPRP